VQDHSVDDAIVDSTPSRGGDWHGCSHQRCGTLGWPKGAAQEGQEEKRFQKIEKGEKGEEASRASAYRRSRHCSSWCCQPFQWGGRHSMARGPRSPTSPCPPSCTPVFRGVQTAHP
jgi:hypothetical protein